MFSALF